jgi:HKD family nuclease
MKNLQVKIFAIMLSAFCFVTMANGQTVNATLTKQIATQKYQSLTIPTAYKSSLSIEKAAPKDVKFLTVNFKGNKSFLFVVDQKGKVLYTGQNTNSGPILQNFREFMECAEPIFRDYSSGGCTQESAALGIVACGRAHLGL